MNHQYSFLNINLLNLILTVVVLFTYSLETSQAEQTKFSSIHENTKPMTIFQESSLLFPFSHSLKAFFLYINSPVS